MHESHQHELAVFLTLTYSNEHLPSDGSLVKADFQKFMKRLRKHHEYYNQNGNKLKYYMCGEYGGNTKRPHYHAIVFGLDFSDKRKHSKGKRGDQLYTSELLNKIWGLGYCWIGSVNHKSAGYVARYCIKKVNGDRAAEHYETFDTVTGEVGQLIPEYMACSQGMGEEHFKEHYDQMYLRDSVIMDGKQHPIPKYYDKKLAEIDPDRLVQVKQQRKEKALLRREDTTPERLAVRHEVKKAQVNFLKRDLHND